MLPGVFYKTCQLELVGILMLENVNKLQHFEACLHVLLSKRFLTQAYGYLPYGSNQLA